jgi:hypothetical protein
MILLILLLTAIVTVGCIPTVTESFQRLVKLAICTNADLCVTMIICKKELSLSRGILLERANLSDHEVHAFVEAILGFFLKPGHLLT